MTTDVLTEPEFRLAADAALDQLERHLLPVCDAHEVEIERQHGVLQIVFEAPHPSKFIVSPNAPVRQIWVSAMSRSYKLSWSAAAKAFVLDGVSLVDLLTRLVDHNLGIS
jgi:CyaY protein